MSHRWMKVGVALLVGFGLAAAAKTGFAQERSKQQKWLAAEKVAEMNAQRALIERIKGMRIEAATQVVNFALVGDQINARMDDVLRGARKVDVKHFEDGSCEVTMEVTVAELIENLKYVLKGIQKGDTFKGYQFEELTIKTEEKVIQAKGQGTGEEPTVAQPGTASPGIAVAEPPRVYALELPGVWKNVSAQQRLGAEKSAEIVAKRNLVERVFGVRITGESTVRDFVLESDSVEAKSGAFIVGSYQKGPSRFRPDGIVEVTVAIPVDQVIVQLKQILEGHYHGDRFHGRDFEQIKISVKTQEFEAVGGATFKGDAVPDVTKEVRLDVEGRVIKPAGEKTLP